MTLLLRATAVAVLAGAPVAITAAPLAAQRPNDPRAVAIIDQAIARMGGEAALRRIASVRMDVMTQWQRTGFSNVPSTDAPSYERNIELRDYATRSWRNTRIFLPGANGAVDIVRDTVGARTFFGTPSAVPPAPLNIAYVDERRELWAFAPERTLLVARDAGGLRLLADTTMEGVAYARLAGRAEHFDATWFIRRTDHLPAFARFRFDETNDFGLAGWGPMEVEIWWAGWTRYAPGVLLPKQRDTRRVGRPYKRMTIMALTVNAPAPADSFAIADSIVTRYLATEQRPMWALPLDGTAITDSTFITFPPFLGNAGAVKVGGGYVLLETAQADSAAGLIDAFLRARTGQRAHAGVVARVLQGNGGVAWFARQARPVFVAPGAQPFVQRMVPAAHRARTTTITRAQWVRVGSDSLWLEPVDFPDYPGTLTVYSPTLRWLYVPLGGAPAFQPEIDALIARIEKRGGTVEWLGGARALKTKR
ncbi:MAG: hypothetical protein LCH84_01700 [Gemmatimonadetes bacterium]|nr:hypothetical protein [Gemmatimonadota bacterium]